MEIFVSAVIAAGLVYLFLKVEEYYRIWRWKRSRRVLPPIVKDESTKGLVTGAAEPRACGRCGKLIKDYFEYADGDAWCVSCDDAELI